MNDLLSTLKESFAFADDLKLLRKIVSLNDCQEFQLKMNRLQNWCISNKLDLNVKKCAVMSITRKTENTRIDFPYALGR